MAWKNALNWSWLHTVAWDEIAAIFYPCLAFENRDMQIAQNSSKTQQETSKKGIEPVEA